jgi:hypothetical protein
MKKRIVIVTLAMLACLVVGYVGYVVGATRGGARAARSSNTDSLLYFTSIHKLLTAEEFGRAKDTAEMAVDGHIGALRQLDADARSALIYAWPWAAADPAVGARQKVISETRKYFLSLPGVLEPQTREFLTEVSLHDAGT